MKYVLGWISIVIFFAVLAVGGFLMAKRVSNEVFTYQKIEELSFGKYDINDFINQKVECKNDQCSFKNKEINYTISEVTSLGKQNIDLEIDYNNKKYNHRFEVNIVDNIAPEIILSEKYVAINKDSKWDPKNYILEIKDNYEELNIKDIEIENPVDVHSIGEYEVIYKIKDSTGNEGKSSLKVVIKKPNERVELPTIQPSNPDTFPDKKQFEAKISTTGVFDFNNTLNQDNKTGSITKELIVGWDSTLNFDFTLKGSNSYTIKYNIANYDASPNNLRPIVSSEIYVQENKEIATNRYKDSYTFDKEGTYYIYIAIKDKSANIVLEQKIKLIVKEQEKFDAKIKVKDVSNYVELDFDYIGNANGYYVVMAATIMSSNDVRITEYPYIDEDIIVNEGDKVKLNYKKGCHYNLLIVIANEKEEILYTQTLNIQK